MTGPEETAEGPGPSFGIEAFDRDDRLRLFSFTHAEKSRQYLLPT